MPVPDSQAVTRVMLVSEAALENAADSSLMVVKLRHPKTEAPACFLYNSHTHQIFEMLSFNEEYRSWFLEERVIPDGGIYLSSPVSPLLLALPYMAKADKLVPLDQVLEDDDCPRTDSILPACLSPSLLSHIAERKGAEDLNVWKYQEAQALEWLAGRVDRVAKVLAKQRVDLSSGAKSLNFKSEEQGGDTDYQRMGLGILQEYLSEDMATKLVTKLNLPEEKVKPGAGGQKRLSEVAGSGDTPRAKKAKVEPLEDYTKGEAKAAVKDEQSAKQKALAQSAKGSKSITSFFTKK